MKGGELPFEALQIQSVGAGGGWKWQNKWTSQHNISQFMWGVAPFGRLVNTTTNHFNSCAAARFGLIVDGNVRGWGEKWEGMYQGRAADARGKASL
eukprot:scaffold55560_cov30-Tisochrysis_lutea.AAC.3